MLGDNIKELMRIKKVSSKELANLVNVSPTHISYVINNKRYPSLELLEKIANVLEVSVDDFFKEDSEYSTKIKKTPSILEGANENTLKFFKELEKLGLFSEDMPKEELEYLINIIKVAMNKPD
ncbi:helix-turn-helix domain-containing protein [Tissierella sp. MSJ-40]|uniref:Helix-turn-helix domain-containing protein n=1 Tax=Tissierella simiarum TaxID=2841534 RepID=A0ABS6EBF8_9FIRM|nr:helix-turn-helix transcriptional regulator [Tissierella simiarum]MBU5440265.1 helix-turn-helix domain-containing protein [Tissierella simiarum]